jgi:nitrite reductase/ring-hydroxylating ferredoxin subunit
VSAQRTVEEFVVGDLDDFPVGTHRVIRAGRREIGVFHLKDGFYGLPNLCPHQTGPLCEGRRLTGTTGASAENGWRIEWVHEGEIIACPWHGIEYHVPTGRCLAFPEITLRRYEVVVQDGKVVVRA